MGTWSAAAWKELEWPVSSSELLNISPEISIPSTHPVIAYGAECDEYIRIFEYSNIFDPNIYSDISSYHFLDTNIFGYSFVSTVWI